MNPASSRASFGEKDWISSRTFGLVIFAGGLAIAMALVSRPFLTGATFVSQSRYIALYTLIALAQAVCLAVGDLNLAVGAVGSLVTVLLGTLLSPAEWHLSGWVAVPLALIVGPLTGVLHGWMITRWRIDAFIVTLSMMFVYLGLRSGISGGNSYTVPAGFSQLGQGTMPGGIPWLVVVAVASLAVLAFIYKYTVLGRRLLATGSNPTAARFSGINTRRMVICAHAISGGFSALAAVLWTSWSGNAAPQTGDDWLIISFAVAIIGGTGVKGNLISPAGIFMGAVIFKLIQHSLVILKVNDNYSNTLLGGLILLAIVVDRGREHLEAKRAH